MATLIDEHTLKEIVFAHNEPFRWPDRTCLHPAIDVLAYIRRQEVPLDPILEMDEEDAGWMIVKYYGSRWFKFVEHYLIKHDFGYTIPVPEMDCGDIVEFQSGRIRAVGPAGDIIKNPVAMVADKKTLLLRGFAGISGIKVNTVKVIRAARFKGVE